MHNLVISSPLFLVIINDIEIVFHFIIMTNSQPHVIIISNQQQYHGGVVQWRLDFLSVSILQVATVSIISK